MASQASLPVPGRSSINIDLTPWEPSWASPPHWSREAVCGSVALLGAGANTQGALGSLAQVRMTTDSAKLHTWRRTRAAGGGRHCGWRCPLLSPSSLGGPLGPWEAASVSQKGLESCSSRDNESTVDCLGP